MKNDDFSIFKDILQNQNKDAAINYVKTVIKWLFLHSKNKNMPPNLQNSAIPKTANIQWGIQGRVQGIGTPPFHRKICHL